MFWHKFINSIKLNKLGYCLKKHVCFDAGHENIAGTYNDDMSSNSVKFYNYEAFQKTKLTIL